MSPNALSIINFVYFTANFPYNFIESVWGVNTVESNHLKSKLNGCQIKSGKMSYIDSGTVLAFFFELSRDNQAKLADWIQENYHWSDEHRIATMPELNNGLKAAHVIIDECKNIQSRSKPDTHQ